MEDLQLYYHWNSSIQLGAERIDREKITKALLSREKRIDNNQIKLSTHNDDFGQRQSERDFQPDTLPIHIEEISTLLCNSTRLSIKDDQIKRATPSAGGLYPIRTYLLANGVNGLNRGVYLYNPYHHSLSFHSNLAIDRWRKAFLNQPFTEYFLLSFVFVLDNDLISSKYGARGYRYGLIEAGHIAQNIQVLSNRLGIASVPVGGFIDYDVADLLSLSMGKELPLYSLFLGHTKSSM